MTDPAVPAAPLVVFLVHATDRTGPPRVLLHQIRWLRAHTDWRLAVVTLREGDLQAEFEAVGDVFVVGEHHAAPTDPAGVAEETRRDAARRAVLASLAPADLVYVNTAWSIHLLHLLPARPDGRPRPRISAVHELDHDLRHTLDAAARADLLAGADHVLAGAEVIARNLVDGHGVPTERVTVVREAIELPDVTVPPTLDRPMLGIAPDTFVVSMAGSPVWRKGPDLFVHVAWHLCRLRPERTVRFRWIGAAGSADEPDLRTPLADVARLGLESVVEFVPATELVFDHLRASDVFLLTSREDASPLVCLEAAAVGLPVVCFDTGQSGANVGPDGALVIRYPDVPAMAAALAVLADDPDEAHRRGRAGQVRVRERHDIAVAGAQLAALIRSWLP